METHSRSLLKTVSWRAAATAITAGVAYFLTGRIELALTIGLGDTAVKLFVYYLHERFWARIRYGLRRTPEYEI